MPMLSLGIENLKSFKSEIDGNIALLCHSASVTSNLTHSIDVVKNLFGERLKKLFGPQHGLVTDVQDNMIETEDFFHPHYQLPVYSLYGETRAPTEKMLEGIDTLIIDLQDVGTRVYTYIQTLSLCLQACSDFGVSVVVLDRPNPVGGLMIEGNILEPEFKSFVGLHEIPQRHGMTMGEMANWVANHLSLTVNLKVIEMSGWKREMSFSDTGLFWVNPSPNLSTPDSAYSFVGSVLFEGTNVSEGRGTTRGLELIGHPKIEAYSFSEHLNKKLNDPDIYFRPQVFLPTFHKWQGQVCGGVQLHCLTPSTARMWRAGQFLCQEIYHHIGGEFEWSKKPYEYEFSGLAIDFINGTDKVRAWVESQDSLEKLEQIEKSNHDYFLKTRQEALLY